eukprot:1374091-Lingulodinium_polyedra.AAC.1
MPKAAACVGKNLRSECSVQNAPPAGASSFRSSSKKPPPSSRTATSEMSPKSARLYPAASE